MDEAMRRYSAALQTMLDSACLKPEILKVIHDSKASFKKQASQLMDKKLLKSLNTFHVQPFKDALKIEFISLIESYLKRRSKSEGAQFPIITVSHHEILDKLNKDSCSLKHLNKLFEKYEANKTIYFCRYSENRDYCLLYDPIKRKFYAKLYLLCQNDELKHMPVKHSDTPLVVVGKNTHLPASVRPERYILLPLSFGKEQERLLEQALERPGMLKTARLIKKQDAYFLTISMAIEPEAAVETRSYAGFHASAEGILRYHVSDLKGKLITHETVPCPEGNPFPQEKDKLHVIANRIAEICMKNQAQAVFESYPHYNRLSDILSYKLPLKGLQKPVRVSPFGLWDTCPRCGYNCKKNNAMGTIFICAVCGFGMEHELLPSYNLSKRLIKYHSDKVRFYCETHGRKKIIRNLLLNIECSLSSNQGIDVFFEKVKAETDALRDYLKSRETGWTRKDRKLYSLWNKLLNTDDVRKVIEIDS